MEITNTGVMKGNIEGSAHVEGYGEFVDEMLTRMKTFKNQRTFSMNNLSNTSSFLSDPVMSVTVNGFTKSRLVKSTARRRQPTSSMILNSPAKSVTSVESCNSNSILVWSLVGDSSLECQYNRRFCRSTANRSKALSRTSKSKSPGSAKRYTSVSRSHKERSRKVPSKLLPNSASSASGSNNSCNSEGSSVHPFRWDRLNNIARKGTFSRTSVCDYNFDDGKVAKSVYEKRKTISDSHLFKRSQCSTQCLPLELQRIGYCSKKSCGLVKHLSNSKSSGTNSSLKGSLSNLHRRCSSHLSRNDKHKKQNQKIVRQTYSKRVTNTTRNADTSSPHKLNKSDNKMDKKCATSPRNKYSILRKIRQFCKHLKNNSNRDTRTLAIL